MRSILTWIVWTRVVFVEGTNKWMNCLDGVIISPEIKIPTLPFPTPSLYATHLGSDDLIRYKAANAARTHVVITSMQRSNDLSFRRDGGSTPKLRLPGFFFGRKIDPPFLDFFSCNMPHILPPGSFNWGGGGGLWSAWAEKSSLIPRRCLLSAHFWQNEFCYYDHMKHRVKSWFPRPFPLCLWYVPNV